MDQHETTRTVILMAIIAAFLVIAALIESFSY
jgi:hypothetical protein